jgi:hypothetical protein
MFLSGQEEHWLWAYSDENLTDSFWGANFPNTSAGNTDDCALMVVQSDKFWWQDSSCLSPTAQSKTIAPICQHERVARITSSTLPTTTTTPLCQEGWEEFQGHCYIFSNNPSYWLSAEFLCLQSGAHLASLHSKAEQDFVLKISTNNIWIGGSDIITEVCIFFKIVKKKQPCSEPIIYTKDWILI